MKLFSGFYFLMWCSVLAFTAGMVISTGNGEWGWSLILLFLLPSYSVEMRKTPVSKEEEEQERKI